MLRYSGDILLISLLISGISATLVYLALHYLFVRPMRRITANMMAFRAGPEDPDRIMVPSDRADEIGTAERELSAMQSDLASMLHQKSRLAALGLDAARRAAATESALFRRHEQPGLCAFPIDVAGHQRAQ